MNCCGLSSTGLNDIEANNITSDNITIFSNLNVSGFSNLNELLVNDNVTFITSLNISGFTTLNKTTILSSLNVSGFTTLNNITTLLSSLNVSGFTNLDNTTNINGSLYISGLNVLDTLNSYSTSLSILNDTTSQNQNTLITLGTGLSTLYNFRSDNESALITQASTTFSTLIHGVYPGSEIKFGTILSKNNVSTQGIGTEFLTKIDTDSKLCVYHPFNVLLPIRTEGYWVVHDELESLQKQAIIDFGKFASLNFAVDKVVVVAGGAAAGVGAISAYLGLNSILSIFSGGGSLPDPIDITGINTNINTLNNTTNSILGYINNLTRYSILNSNGLDVSGVSILYGNTSLFSSLNVSGYTSLNNDATLLSSLNVSGFTTLNNNTTLLSSLNISGFALFNNNTTLVSSLNVSGFTTLHNHVSLVSSMNVSGFTTLNNNVTLLSSLNVSGHSTLKSITLNKDNVDPSGDSLNFWYNTPGTYFIDNGFSSYFSLNSNVSTNTGLAVEPFIRVYNRMWKNGANTAMDLKTFGNSNSNVNSDVLIRLDSGGNPSIGSNSGKIIYNINGSDRHIMTSTGLGINTTSPGIFALNVSGDTLLSTLLNVSGFTTLNNNVSLVSSLNVSGFTTLSNNATIYGTLNISGKSQLVNDTTLVSSLNVSGLTTLSNNTTLASSLNVSGFTILNNNSTLASSLNVSGLTTLSNNTSIFGILNVSGFTTLNNNSTIVSSLNISGFTTLNNNVTLSSSLNVSGRTIIGNNNYNYSDSSFEVNKNLMIRNYVTNGSRIDMQVGLGYEKSYISLEQGYDINIYTPSGGSNTKSIGLSSDQITLTAPNTYISGKLNSLNGLNIGSKSPISFTTNRNVNINGITFSCYDLDLNLYTKYITLDGYNIRQFRFRSWLADADFQMYNAQQTRYDIFMSNKNGLSVYAFAVPFDNSYLDETKFNEQFLYRNDFNTVMYCSRWGVKKVYCIIEDLL